MQNDLVCKIVPSIIINPYYAPPIIYIYSFFWNLHTKDLWWVWCDFSWWVWVFEALQTFDRDVFEAGVPGVGFEQLKVDEATLDQFQIGGREFVRLGIQEWFLRPKCHAPWQQRLSVELLACILV